MATPRGSTCVGYIAPYTLPEVQRHINAFALGCRARFAGCVVRVVWVGAWHDVAVERAAAEFFWHEAGCDILTQGTDTDAGQLVYRERGMGIGYNSHMRERVGQLAQTGAVGSKGQPSHPVPMGSIAASRSPHALPRARPGMSAGQLLKPARFLMERL